MYWSMCPWVLMTLLCHLVSSPGVFTGWIGWFAVSWASPWVARWGHSQDVQLRNLLHGLLVSEIKSELIQPDFCDQFCLTTFLARTQLSPRSRLVIYLRLVEKRCSHGSVLHTSRSFGRRIYGAVTHSNLWISCVDLLRLLCDSFNLNLHQEADRVGEFKASLARVIIKIYGLRTMLYLMFIMALQIVVTQIYSVYLVQKALSSWAWMNHHSFLWTWNHWSACLDCPSAASDSNHSNDMIFALKLSNLSWFVVVLKATFNGSRITTSSMEFCQIFVSHFSWQWLSFQHSPSATLCLAPSTTMYLSCDPVWWSCLKKTNLWVVCGFEKGSENTVCLGAKVSCRLDQKLGKTE